MGHVCCNGRVTYKSPGPGCNLASNPPASYVQLVSEGRAVVVARGRRAHDAHVISVVNAGGMPLLKYLYRDVRESRYAIRAPVNAEKIKVLVDFQRAYQALAEGSID